MENYLLAINLVLKKDDDAANVEIGKRQVAILLNQAGDEANEVFSQFEYTVGKGQDKLADVLEKFEEYCNPIKNILYETYVFWSLCQADGEPIDNFVKRLKTQAAKCEFGNMKDRMLLCRIVFGLSDPKLKERLLRDSEMTLSKALDDIHAAEMTKKQLVRISDGDKSSIDAVGQTKFPAGRSLQQGHTSDRPKPTSDAKRSDVINCQYCSYNHPKGHCPAYGKACKKCGKMNHFEKVCKSAKVQAVETSEPEKQLHSLFIGCVDAINHTNTKSWMLPLDVKNAENSMTVNFKIDTGAEANVIPLAIAKNVNAQLKATDTRLHGYNRSIIKTVGHVLLDVNFKHQPKQCRFEVVDEELPPILGLETCEALGIVQRIDEVTSSILDHYSDVFEGIGQLEGTHDISIDSEVRPVVHAPRRVPLSMMSRVKQELECMEKAGIIAKVDKPTDWVSSMVCVEKKDGSVRICLDPKDLNKAVKREHHKIPTMEDIAVKFAGMKFYTILDMKHGYWHVALSSRSSLLTTFNTPFGRYCFKRLPFGLHSSAEVFEKKVEQIFGDIPNVAIYFDDLVVAGRMQEEHDETLHKLLTRARKANVKFNRQKVQLNRTEVKYLGHIVSKDGMRPDPAKVEAIQSMQKPTDKAGIQRLIGTLNFLRSYIPNMSALTEPLRELLKNDVLWTWGPKQQESFNMVKRILTSKPVLQYFDVNKETHLQVDASKSGLGAVLLQDGKPVAYASRALTECECNYPQIDKELLAVVFGCEKFHSYLYGRPLHAQTDHKPLVPILKKPLHNVPPRLQRFILRLQRYHIASLTYVPGKYLYIADTLSRAYLQKVSSEQAEMDGEVVMVHTLEVDDKAKEELIHAYSNDNTMSELNKAVYQGWNWPSRKQAPACLQPYWNIRADIYESDGFLYVGERLIIPHALRKQILQKLHMGHLGVQKCTERARKSFFWPGLSNDIREEVSKCESCMRFSNKQRREPLMPHEVPELPWYKVAMDIMEFRSRNYLVVVDSFSHFPELRLLGNKTADDIILALKSIFSVHGVPVSIMADNMPFNSQRMLSFANDWGFRIVTSSPRYPKSNGMAERYVQTMKLFLKKCEDSGEDVYKSLLAYRETPLSGCNYSPAEMLFNRSLRSNLPITTQTLRPTIPLLGEQLEHRQATYKQYYDRGTRPLDILQPGDKIWTRTDSDCEWTQATVVDRHDAPRSYLIDNGQSIVRRNRSHVKPDTTEPATESIIPEDFNLNESNSAASPVHDQTLSSPSSPAMQGPRRTRNVLPQRFKDYDMSC